MKTKKSQKMQSTKRALLAATVIAGTVSLVSFSAPAQNAGPIKIGFIAEQSGFYSYYGTACVKAMQLAEKKINDAGGVLNRPLQFIVTDSQSNPSQGAAAARSLDVQDNVLAISGPVNSDVALAVYGYVEQNKIPLVLPAAAYAQLTKPGTRYTFRVEPDAVGWGYAYAKFLGERKPGAKVVYMYLDIAVTRAISAGLKYQAPRSKIEVLSEVVFPQGSSDATVQAAQVAAMKPDYVIVGTVGAFDITLTNQLLDLGFKPEQLLHILGTSPSILGYGKRSVGSLYGTFFDANLENVTPVGQQFVKEYTEQVGRIPSFVENYCFISPYIIKAAIEKAGAVDREKFRDALGTLKMVEPTSSVAIEFDKNGARKEYMYMMEIQSVAEKTYTAKKIYYLEWDPEVIPVYDLVK
jgi:branched-chain amino acid transport system substrate-binding protein